MRLIWFADIPKHYKHFQNVSLTCICIKINLLFYPIPSNFWHKQIVLLLLCHIDTVSIYFICI